MAATDSPATPHREEGPALPDVSMHLHTPASPCVGTVVSSERCTSGKSHSFVRHVSIDVSGTQIARTIRPGQSFGVVPPGLDDRDRPHKLRLYSVSSPTRGEDGAGTVIATTVKRTIDEHWESHKLFLGVASNYLCDLQVGDKVTLTGPSGKRFLVPADPSAHDYVFVATGTGIAPFRGMLIDLLEAGVQSRIALVMGVPHANDLLYHDFLSALAAKHPNFSYITALSREKQHDGSAPMYVQNRLLTHRDLLTSILASDRGLLYICGLAGMELGVFQQLARVLPAPALDQYLRVDADALASIDVWERRMIHKQVRPTRRVFTEVY
jgi:ferredoxin--NADP+ reductase